MTSFERRPGDHLTEEEMLLYLMDEDVLHPQQREAMYRHVVSCFDCLDRTAEPLRQKFPLSDAEHVIAGPGSDHRSASARSHGRFRLAASPRTLNPTAAEIAATRLQPFVMIGGVEFLRVPGEPNAFMVDQVAWAERRVTMVAADVETITIEVDGFGRCQLSNDDQTLLAGWANGGSQIEFRVQ